MPTSFDIEGVRDKTIYKKGDQSNTIRRKNIY